MHAVKHKNAVAQVIEGQVKHAFFKWFGIVGACIKKFQK